MVSNVSAPDGTVSDPCRQCYADLCSRHTPRVVYAHVPKTGGTSIECASEPLVRIGAWLNLGHASGVEWTYIKQLCQNAKLVVSVRDPYDYFASEYSYAHSELARGTGGSSTANSILSGVGVDGLTGPAAAVVVMANFSSFMHWLRKVKHNTQSGGIWAACGRPCSADFVVRAESSQIDLDRLAAQAGLAAFTLSRHNPSNHSAVRAEYDCELLDMVYRMERRMFDEFGYVRRACPSAKFPAGGETSIWGQAFVIRNTT